MTTMDPFQAEVARAALAAARPHGFALGGGHALIAHDVVMRPTEDVDLFTDAESGVQAATSPVARALSTADLPEELAESMRRLDRLHDSVFESSIG